MHEAESLAALSRYDALGGDALLEKFDYDPLPECVYKRLEVAEQLTKELMCQDEWAHLGRQPFADGGIQYYVVFEGMLKDLQRRFEAHVLKTTMPVFQFPDSSYFVHRLIDNMGPDSFPVTKREFIESIETPLREVAGRILQSANDVHNIRGFVKLLFTNRDFIEVAFEHIDSHTGSLKQRLDQVVKFQHSGNDPAVSAEAFRLCCEAAVASAEKRQSSMVCLTKLGNRTELCPAFVIVIASDDGTDISHTMLRPVHQCKLFRQLWYYQAVRNESDRKFGFESEALLSSADMETVRRNYEITDGYVLRFFGKFKRFKPMIYTHPKTFFRILQMKRGRHLRELVEAEFGIHIPLKPLCNAQRRESTDSDPGSDTDSDLPHVDPELDDDVLPDIGKDLWDLIGDFIEALYATRRTGHPF